GPFPVPTPPGWPAAIMSPPARIWHTEPAGVLESLFSQPSRVGQGAGHAVAMRIQATMSNDTNLLQREAHCNDCSLACMCLPISLHADEMDSLYRIVKRGRPLSKGDVLFRQGDEINSHVALRRGAIKTYGLSDEGD